MQSSTEDLEHNILLYEDIENALPVDNTEKKLYIKKRLKYNRIVSGGCCSYDWTCSWTGVSTIKVGV